MSTRPLRHVELIVLVLCVTWRYSVAVSDVTDACYVRQAGCKYRVTVIPTAECVAQGDQPVVPGTTPEVTELSPEEQASLKRIENLEQTLTRMMEELSVRSLRHIRQIRSDLRQMTSSMNQLKTKTSTKSLGSVVSVRQCPAEFIGVGTWPSCYRFSSFNATWHEAREYCSAFGAGLLALDSVKEAVIVEYIIKSNPEYQEPKGWWTSGNYVVRNQKWMWSSRQQLKPISFSRWAPGEPNARSTMHCMVMYRPDKYYWHDATCTDRHNFVCEIE